MLGSYRVFISKGDSVKVRARRLTALIFLLFLSFVPLHLTFARKSTRQKKSLLLTALLRLYDAWALYNYIRQRDKWLFWFAFFFFFSFSLSFSFTATTTNETSRWGGGRRIVPRQNTRRNFHADEIHLVRAGFDRGLWRWCSENINRTTNFNLSVNLD